MEHSALTTEADVETQVVIPLSPTQPYWASRTRLSKAKYIWHQQSWTKKSGKTHGYIPDFSVWVEAPYHCSSLRQRHRT